MDQALTIRRADLADLSAVNRLLSRSYTRLLSADYAPSTMVMAIPIVRRTVPTLVASGRYVVAMDGTGHVKAAGGWSFAAPGAAEAPGWPEAAYVRHVATDPDFVRQGLARAIMAAVMQDAAGFGLRGLDCLSTWTAVPFYTALGFRVLYPTEVSLGPGIVFPVVRMLTDLPPT